MKKPTDGKTPGAPATNTIRVKSTTRTIKSRVVYYTGRTEADVQKAEAAKAEANAKERADEAAQVIARAKGKGKGAAT
jgi:hypothetical protein